MLSWGLFSVMVLQSNVSLSSQCQTDSGIGVRPAMAMSAVPPLHGPVFLAWNWQVLTVSSVHLQANMKCLLAFLDLSL